jgi:hypothetical protein
VCEEVDAKETNPTSVWDRTVPDVIELFPWADQFRRIGINSLI